MFYWSNRFKNPLNSYEVYIKQYYLSLLNNIDYFRIPYNSVFLPILLTLFFRLGLKYVAAIKRCHTTWPLSLLLDLFCVVTQRSTKRTLRDDPKNDCERDKSPHRILSWFLQVNQTFYFLYNKPYLPKRFFVFFSRCIQIFLKVSNTIILCSSL